MHPVWHELKDPERIKRCSTNFNQLYISNSLEQHGSKHIAYFQKLYPANFGNGNKHKRRTYAHKMEAPHSRAKNPLAISAQVKKVKRAWTQ
ncbi:hypothetical protein CEXT_140351 [Caerostris extrusa]|uniref:Uncharacterized protein n=1 Tax=Caerostris extrusa TaxID=172846 RepID=A0AAV4XQ70_CAEEX|nr:hypothetical protein CEXT_140351 [Caerostris extrusa]